MSRHANLKNIIAEDL
jgi:hypothetical protein